MTRARRSCNYIEFAAGVGAWWFLPTGAFRNGRRFFLSCGNPGFLAPTSLPSIASAGGLDHRRIVLSKKKVQVLLLFATNRLFRKVYLTLQFVDQTAVENDIRCVFVKSGIDTANKDQWQSLLHMRSMMDEFQVRVNGDHISAALKGMLLEGLVWGTLQGSTGEPISGKLTKRGRPRRRIVIHPEHAKLVLQVFERYVCVQLSLSDIARKLNAMPDVPKPRNSSRWSDDSVRAVLLRDTYRGRWKFSVTERKVLSCKDWTGQCGGELWR